MEEGGKFRVVLLGIIYDPKEKKILIGRREKDKDIPQLTWCFPGGQVGLGENMETVLREKIKGKTGLEVESLGCIYSRIPEEKDDLVLIYALCEATGGEEKEGDSFVELKWVDPEELENHFTTSFHPHVKEYILNLK